MVYMEVFNNHNRTMPQCLREERDFMNPLCI